MDILDILNSGRSQKHKPLPYKMTLNNFLKFLKFMEQSMYNLPLETQSSFWEFKGLITDIQTCAITGSAVLEHRINRDIDSNDLDFFIKNTEKNQEIVREFFNNKQYHPLFLNFLEEILGTKKEEVVYPSGFYVGTSINDYSFTKGLYKLETYRWGYTDINLCGFQLNFIFVSELTPTEKRMLALSDSVPKLFNNFLKSRLRGIEDEEIKQLIPDIPHLEIIYLYFDFEELKYVYFFGLQQIITVPSAVQFIIKDFTTLLKNSDEEKYSKYFNHIDSLTNKLLNLNNQLVELTSDKNSMTLSDITTTSPIFSRMVMTTDISINYSSSFESLASHFKDKASRPVAYLGLINSLLLNLSVRIPKYQNKGFVIKDPHATIQYLQGYQFLLNLYIARANDINQVALQNALTGGNPKILKIEQIAREARQAIEQIALKHNICDIENEKSIEEF